MLPEFQEDIEKMFSKSNIRKAIKKEIEETDGAAQIITEGKLLLIDYINKAPEYHDSKRIRVEQLLILDLEEIVMEVIMEILVLEKTTLFTQVVGQLAGKLGFSDKGDGVKTSAEILAVLCDLDIYDIIKESKQASLMVRPRITPSEGLQRFIAQTKYLPPMIVPPKKVRSNYDSGYLTKRDSLILGGNVNFHEDDICLDSINRFNQVPLSLNVELLKTYSEIPKKLIEDPERKEQWEKFVKDSYLIYRDLIHQGNEFWLTHKVDKRGRTYAQGYHVSTQGNAFRKAIIELHDKEIVEGV